MASCNPVVVRVKLNMVTMVTISVGFKLVVGKVKLGSLLTIKWSHCNFIQQVGY